MAGLLVPFRLFPVGEEVYSEGKRTSFLGGNPSLFDNPGITVNSMTNSGASTGSGSVQGGYVRSEYRVVHLPPW